MSERETFLDAGIGIEPGPEPTYSVEETVRRSPSIGKLAEALAKSQITFQPIRKSVENTFYTTDRKKAMYADLAAVIAATQRSLAENGLVIMQSPIIRTREKQAGTRSLLVHSSGEWLENEVVLPATAKVKIYADKSGSYTWGEKFDAQTCGIAITYSRRYSYQSLIGVAAEEDDDGNSIGEPANGSKEAAQAVAKAKKEASGYVESLFYAWDDETQTAIITGPQEMLENNRELLKKLWVPKKGACVADAESLEALKYEFEQRKVPFAPLKSGKSGK